jgi:hypothetical protein
MKPTAMLATLITVSAAPYGRSPCGAGERLEEWSVGSESTAESMCMPECGKKGGCPSFGGHATPTCDLVDGGVGYCELVCSSDDDCDYEGGANCVATSAGAVSQNICLYGWRSFWSWHILPATFTGAANKDLCNEHCEVGFVAFYCFGQQKAYSDYNIEEHVDGNVIEYLHLSVDTSADGSFKFDQYLSCCPPGSKTNPGGYYRCNTWTGQDNNNCHVRQPRIERGTFPQPRLCR